MRLWLWVRLHYTQENFSEHIIAFFWQAFCGIGFGYLHVLDITAFPNGCCVTVELSVLHYRKFILPLLNNNLVFNFDLHEKMWVCLMVSWLASWLPREVSKTSVLTFSGINVMNVRLCMVVLHFGRYWFMPLSVTRAISQGHSSVIF